VSRTGAPEIARPGLSSSPSELLNNNSPRRPGGPLARRSRPRSRGGSFDHLRRRTGVLAASPAADSQSRDADLDDALVASGKDAAAAARWGFARRATGAIAAAGVVETSYLTWQKLSGGAVAFCAAGQSAAGCNSVLTGPYSTVAGVPLSALGLLSYAALAALCLTGWTTTTASSTTTSASSSEAAAVSFGPTPTPKPGVKVALVALTAFMAAFSVYLVAVLATKLHAACAFCFGSAALSWSALAVVQRAAWGDYAAESSSSSAHKGDSTGTTTPTTPQQSPVRATLGAIAAAGLAAGLASYAQETQLALDEATAIAAALTGGRGATTSAVVSSSTTGAPVVTFAPPEVETQSTPRTMRLARTLRSKGARMYGAYWCSHCFAQKQKFGKEAAALIEYVECAPDGDASRRAECQARGVAGYPTWDIDGKLYPGEKSIAELEALVGIDPAVPGTTTTSDALRLPLGTAPELP